MMNENVGSIMTTNLITVGPSDTLQTVKDILISRRIHHVPVVEEGIMVGLVSIDDLFHALPVVDDGKLVGIVTSFDLLKYEYNKEYPPKA